jgi:hypothetical protein
VILHGVADDVGHFVEAPVVLLLQRMEDAALDRLEPVVDVGDGALEDDVARVVQKPV